MVSVLVDALRNELKEEMAREFFKRDIAIDNREKEIILLNQKIVSQDKEHTKLQKYVSDLQQDLYSLQIYLQQQQETANEQKAKDEGRFTALRKGELFKVSHAVQKLDVTGYCPTLFQLQYMSLDSLKNWGIQEVGWRSKEVLHSLTLTWPDEIQTPFKGYEFAPEFSYKIPPKEKVGGLDIGMTYWDGQDGQTKHQMVSLRILDTNHVQFKHPTIQGTDPENQTLHFRINKNETIVSCKMDISNSQFPANMQFIMFDIESLEKYIEDYDSQRTFNFPQVSYKK